MTKNKKRIACRPDSRRTPLKPELTSLWVTFQKFWNLCLL